MLRAVVGVIVGYVTWSVLWFVGNRLLFAEAAEVVGAGERYTRTGPLLGVLALSIVCSLAAGAVAARIAQSGRWGAVAVMAVLLLITGIVVQASVWSLMPVWYHVVFLALIIPVCQVGSWISAGAARVEP
jgi:hypothetical protein